MNKYDYNKRLYELAIRMKVCKQKSEGKLIASFYQHAAQGFADRMEKMSPLERSQPVTFQETQFLKEYIRRVKAEECKYTYV